MTKLEQLKDWMRSVPSFSTGELLVWGTDHHYTSTLRRTRELAADGFIRKLTEDEKRDRGREMKTAVYEFKRPEQKEAQLELLKVGWNFRNRG